MADRTNASRLGAAGATLRAGDSLSDHPLRSRAQSLSTDRALAIGELHPDPNGPAARAEGLRGAQSPFRRRRRQVQTTQPFDAAWLSLREPFDAKARSRDLAKQFAALLPERVTLVELGAGSGGLFRWLAPIIARPQRWIWLDDDENHLKHGLRLTAAWGRHLGYTAECKDRTELTLHTPRGTWIIETRGYDLAETPLLPLLDDADGVVCSALLDLFSGQWLAQLLATLGRLPFYAAMTVTGRDWRNLRDRDDALVLEGHRLNQTGDGSPADPLGPEAPEVAEAVCAELGLRCRSVRSDWTIAPRHRVMLRRVLAFHAGGARNALPQHRAWIDAWEARRNRDVDAGRLAMRVAHRDFLISTPQKGPGHAARRRR